MRAGPIQDGAWLRRRPPRKSPLSSMLAELEPGKCRLIEPSPGQTAKQLQPIVGTTALRLWGKGGWLTSVAEDGSGVWAKRLTEDERIAQIKALRARQAKADGDSGHGPG